MSSVTVDDLEQPILLNEEGEKIEGLDNSIDSFGWGDDYPIDSMLIRQDVRSVREVLHRIEKDRYIFDPDFQRDLVWTKYRKSKLIESCIMRIPLPVFYVAEETDGRITIVDGLQRLATFSEFVKNEFKLQFQISSSEGKKHELSGKYFKDLQLKIQERIEDTKLIMYILDPKVPEVAKLDIFERVNSGVPLSRQQMRNALYCGIATRWLKSVVEGSAFKTATNESLSSKKMRDREAVNRFASFTLIGWKNYNGNMDDFLAQGLKELRKKDENCLNELHNKFDKTMLFCYDVFGSDAFRKFSITNIRSVINISLFDVISVLFYQNLSKLLTIDKKIIKNNVINLLREKQFNDCITISTNSKKSVRLRYQKFENLVQNLINR